MSASSGKLAAPTVAGTLVIKKNDGSYTLGKYTSEHKEKKSKGEVIDEYWKLSLTKLFNDIKEPNSIVEIKYEVE